MSMHDRRPAPAPPTPTHPASTPVPRGGPAQPPALTVFRASQRKRARFGGGGYAANVFCVDLGGGAELRPLEPWLAGEFLEHMDRARESVDPWIPWAGVSTDLDSARATLQRYADMQAR